ncbi:MAG: hypothetical protein IPM37_08705 [Hahellaceae bacterium]|nr:hypothetical protein [Hahellaceae bacterium]
MAGIKSLLWSAIEPLMQVVGRAYVPGPALADALAIAAKFSQDGIAVTIGYFPEDEDSAEFVAQQTQSVAEAVASLTPLGYVSVKVPAMDYRSDLLQPILDKAQGSGIRVHFDSHGVDMADATRDCVSQACATGCRVGLTIPGRWSRSIADAEWASAQGVRVRVVKGEWIDPNEPDKDRTEGFLSLVESLSRCAREVAIASHDPVTVKKSIDLLRQSGVACELELLYGMPMRTMLAMARREQIPVRVYIPFGTAWWPYSLGKAVRNPRILGWLIVDILQGVRQLFSRP